MSKHACFDRHLSMGLLLFFFFSLLLRLLLFAFRQAGDSLHNVCYCFWFLFILFFYLFFCLPIININ